MKSLAATALIIRLNQSLTVLWRDDAERRKEKISSQTLPLIQNLWWHRKCEIYSCLGVTTQKRVWLCFSHKKKQVKKKGRTLLQSPSPSSWIISSSGNKNCSSASGMLHHELSDGTQLFIRAGVRARPPPLATAPRSGPLRSRCRVAGSPSGHWSWGIRGSLFSTWRLDLSEGQSPMLNHSSLGKRSMVSFLWSCYHFFRMCIWIRTSCHFCKLCYNFVET